MRERIVEQLLEAVTACGPNPLGALPILDLNERVKAA